MVLHAREATNLMLDDIYNRRILELAADIPRLGRLADPDASATAHSKLCGSTVVRMTKVISPTNHRILSGTCEYGS